MRFNDRRIFCSQAVFVILHNFFNAGGLRNGNSANFSDFMFYKTGDFVNVCVKCINEKRKNLSIFGQGISHDSFCWLIG